MSRHPQGIVQLAGWMAERHAIWHRKTILEQAQFSNSDPLDFVCLSPIGKVIWGEGGWTPAHLTEDPILGTYRFCNVYRELDRVTKWIHNRVRSPWAHHTKLWFMLAVARYINWPPTLEELIHEEAWPHYTNFDPSMMTEVLERRKQRSQKVETGAFMIRAESDRSKPWYSWSKQRYLCEIVLGRLWQNRAVWHRHFEQSDLRICETWATITGESFYVGWGPFMAYQWVVDLAHTKYLRGARDINIWAALGPGSRRGLNRLHDRPVRASLSQERGLEEMLKVRDALRPFLSDWLRLPELSDIQNCLCEWDKYERVRLVEGRPRALYVPGRGW